MKNINVDSSGDDTRALAMAQSAMTLAAIMRRTAHKDWKQVLYINDGGYSPTLGALSRMKEINTVWVEAREITSHRHYGTKHHDVISRISKRKEGAQEDKEDKKLNWHEPLIMVTEDLRFLSEAHAQIPKCMAETASIYPYTHIITADPSREFADANDAKAFLKEQGLATIRINMPLQTDARVLDDRPHFVAKPEILRAITERKLYDDPQEDVDRAMTVAARSNINIWILRREAKALYSTGSRKPDAKKEPIPAQSTPTLSEEVLESFRGLARGIGGEGQV